jgi:hypothetical protein
VSDRFGAAKARSGLLAVDVRANRGVIDRRALGLVTY